MMSSEKLTEEDKEELRLAVLCMETALARLSPDEVFHPRLTLSTDLLSRFHGVPYRSGYMLTIGNALTVAPGYDGITACEGNLFERLYEMGKKLIEERKCKAFVFTDEPELTKVSRW